MKQVVENMKKKLKAAEDKRESTRTEVESVCIGLSEKNAVEVAEIAQQKIEEIVGFSHKEAKEILAELQKDYKRVEQQYEACIEREAFSRHIHDSLSEIVTIYCTLLRNGLVKNLLDIDVSSIDTLPINHLEELVTSMIEKSVKVDRPEEGVLMTMAVDISTSYQTIDTYNLEMMDSVLYLKVSVLWFLLGCSKTRDSDGTEVGERAKKRTKQYDRLKKACPSYR